MCREISVRRNGARAQIALISLLLLPGAMGMTAAEGGSSYYFPGSSGGFSIAALPSPAPLIASQSLFLGANLQGGFHIFATETLAAGFFTIAQHTYKAPPCEPGTEPGVLGTAFQIGMYVPVGYVALTGPNGFDQHDIQLGDLGIIPAFYWSPGNFHFRIAEQIFAPTGHFDATSLVNLGRNYWGFDTELAAMWRDDCRGHEVAVSPGVLVNTPNNATAYHTGTEFHVDVMVNQYTSNSFAAGVQAYYYKQIKGDSGAGAVLGPNKGEAVGLGPAILWSPAQPLVLVAKWVHDVHAVNRPAANYGLLTLAYQLPYR